MMNNRKVLPPLDYLLAFEVSGKAGSFAEAARELNISESAISRKIKLLEEHYKSKLFVRGHQSISITQDGAELLRAVSIALDTLREASTSILMKNQSKPVALAATHSVASLWLMPRLNQFQLNNPDFSIGIFGSDDDTECLAETNDMAILRGTGNWPGFESELLFGETVFPVCSPEFLATYPSAASVESLAELDLIEVASSHAEWMNWSTWFSCKETQHQGLHRTTQVNTYPLAIQAAADGLGVALGWKHLVDNLIDQGKLVCPLGECSVRTQDGYYLLVPLDQRAFPERELVKSWLLQMSAERHRYGQP